ncbi:MAG TPA: hypothetical protein VEL76_32460 [Gemmataceae bacterium]|nr:hypothetical protein [Gemmataceae bacterium]
MSRSPLYAVFFLSVLGLLGPMSSRCRAQGFVEHLEPPALERGKTTRVTIVGSGLGKALGLWTSLPAGAVKATPVGTQTPNRAILDVTVAADAPVGVCGVRLATVDGLGNACLLLIDDLPVRPAVGGKATLPVALWGRFREATVDRFVIDVAAGQSINFEAVGNRLGKDVDPFVTIRDAKGRIVAERDNDPGLYFDFRFEHTFADAGAYTVELRDARFHGSEHGYYVLRLGRFPAARVAVPAAVRPGKRAELRLPELADAVVGCAVPSDATGLFFGVVKRPGDEGSAWLPLEATAAEVTVHQAPGNSLDAATPAKVPGMLCGVLRKPNERQFFRLELAKGQRIQVRAEARAFNSPADLELTITDGKGKELRRVTENVQKEEVVLDFNAGTPGVYGLTVRDVNRDGGPAFAYRLEVRTGQPQIQVTAEVEGLTLPRGDYQPVPLTVTRTDYTGPIALTLAGAPSGVTLTPNEIDAGVNAIVCKLSAAADAPIGIHTLQILARPAAIEGARPTPVRTLPLIDRQIVNVDLIPHALREDQRRLPPALTDRFAVQVTPPAPFTVELPEPLVTLGRYQHVDFPIVVTRGNGFAGPLTYSAKGGQIAPKEEGRTRVYAEFAEGKGSIHSKILTTLAKHRVEVTAVGVHEGRRVALTRTFDLQIRSAFAVTAEPPTLKTEPGAIARVRLNADRMKTFDGDVTVQLSPALGLTLPATVVIPRGQAGVDVELTVAPDRTPGRQSINLNATAVVNGLEEEQRGRLDIDIVKTPAPKK